jgi:cytochrome c peroxidase
LRDVMDHYLGGGIDRPSRSDEWKAIDLTPQEVEDVIEFMRSLTGSRQVVALPVLPN